VINIVFLDSNSFGASVHFSRPSFEHHWVDFPKTAADEVVSRLAGADIAVTNKVPVTGDMLDQLPNLKMIAVTATGYNIIDMNACNERGIVVSNVSGYATNTVPEHTFALILALRRSIIGYRADVAAGDWGRSDQFCLHTHNIQDLNGATLGIIGAGSLGKRVAQIAEAFGMRTLLAARKGASDIPSGYTPFDSVLEESDVITLHCPLTPDTVNLISMNEFQKMKRHPIIINTARGGIVNEHDIVTALDLGLVSGIGFDCLSTEPPSAGNPLLGILDRPNAIITPHIAWASREAKQILWDQSMANIENFQAGKPSNQVK